MKAELLRFKGTSLSHDPIMEVSIIDANEDEPYKKTREVGITVIPPNDPENEFFFDFDEEDLDTLIDYLIRARDHVNTFNANSKAVE